MRSLLALLALACGGCVTLPLADLEREADRLRDTAMKAFEAGDRKTPLELNRHALA